MRQTLVALSAFALLADCSRKESAPDASRSAAETAVPALPEPAYPVGAAGSTVSGTVAETLSAPGYTYLRLTTTGASVWAAVPTSEVKVGQQVVLSSPTLMKGFTSTTLNRTFESIYFASGIEESIAAARMRAQEDQAVAAAHTQTGPGPDAGVIKVDRADGPNARTVAELLGARRELSNKSVAVRGKVVKYTAGVLGKNWVHLRDGTGQASDHTDDLTVTTTDTAAVGDVLSATGVVRLDRDFGSGYVFPVLLEDARLTR